MKRLSVLGACLAISAAALVPLLAQTPKVALYGREYLEAPPKVVNLLEALRKSLDTIGAKKKPATVSHMAAPKKRAGARG